MKYIPLMYANEAKAPPAEPVVAESILPGV